jgi:predicted amidohydrolase
MQNLKVAIFQMEIITGKKEENFTKLVKKLEEFKSEAIDLWILPELFTTGFDYENFSKIAENPNNSDTLNKLETTSKQFSTGIAGTFLIQEDEKYYNLGFIISPQKGLVYQYKKIHLWGNEKKKFTAGKIVPAPVDFEGKAKIGLSICYDLRFPEVSRKLVTQGADVIINSAAWPAQRIDHFNLLASARALENTSYHIAVSRIGVEVSTINGLKVEVEYPGSSRIIDPFGEVIVSTNEKDSVIIATLEGDILEKYRNRVPVLKDRKL